MDKKNIYTIGYTLFQKEHMIDIESLFQTLRQYGIQYLIDVRSIPYSRRYPQCNADYLKAIGKNFNIQYLHMPEIGAKARSSQDVFSKASDIFFEDVFPIKKSSRPENTELNDFEEIVDFRKFRFDEYFIDGLKRIEKAYDKEYTLCLMCSESNPMECHRYFLISKSLETRYGDWLNVKHIIKNDNGNLCTIQNEDLNESLKKSILHKSIFKNIVNTNIFGESPLNNYHGATKEDKIADFCDRYWNLIHGWKKYNNINNDETYD